MSIDNKVFNCNNLQRTTPDVQLHQQLVAASFGGAISAIVSKYPHSTLLFTHITTVVYNTNILH